MIGEERRQSVGRRRDDQYCDCHLKIVGQLAWMVKISGALLVVAMGLIGGGWHKMDRIDDKISHFIETQSIKIAQNGEKCASVKEMVKMYHRNDYFRGE